ncbi:hypothetical protein ACOSP7_002716 [Xanthoceras sorbifolium]
MKEHRSSDSEIESRKLQQPHMSPIMEHRSGRENRDGGEQQQRHLAPSVSTTLYQPEPVPLARQTATGIPPISPSMTQHRESAYGPEQGLSSMLEPLEMYDKVASPNSPVAQYVEVGIIGTVGRGKIEEADYVLNPIMPPIAPVLVESSLVVDTVTVVSAKRGKWKR